MNGYIHSIETFGTVDGPGIRFVVFVKGCPMRCKYCHNPDTWSQSGATLMRVDEILEMYERNKEFYKNGGITVTGGEPLLQIDFITELFKKAHEKGIHCALDTSGIMFNKYNKDKFDELIKYVDLVLLDIKHINEEEHIKLTTHSNKDVLEFAKYLDEHQKEMCIRHVVVPTLNDDYESLYNLGLFIGTLKNAKTLDVLPFHQMGKVKYEALNIDYPLKDYEPLDQSKAVEARNIILKGIKDIRSKK